MLKLLLSEFALLFMTIYLFIFIILLLIIFILEFGQAQFDFVDFATTPTTSKFTS
jgi:hypothetical protein